MKKNEYGVRYCKCGEQLVPHKVWFKDMILYTCPKSNIFNKKNHSISRAFYSKVKPLRMGVMINKKYGNRINKNK